MDKKLCKCGHPRKRRFRPDGRPRGWRCQSCDNERTRVWRMANPEKNAASQRSWTARNRDYKAAADARRYEAKRPELLAQASAYRAANLDTINEKKRAAYHAGGAPARLKLLASNRRARGWASGEHERAEALRPFVTACACCGTQSPRTKKGWMADHDHTTGLFRGFLCHPCNVVVGLVEKFGLARSADVEAYLAREKERAAGQAAPQTLAKV